ncbi:MAG: pyridoxine 5'-phosphate synthase [Rhodospirillaceae bacterium]|nr:pyridoxine 5'-phosphate synthase [Rhodospirillaceae bacterium]
MRRHLGHDLNAENLPPLGSGGATWDEVSIGHAIVSEAVMAGSFQIIRQYAQIIQQEPQHHPMGNQAPMAFIQTIILKYFRK